MGVYREMTATANTKKRKAPSGAWKPGQSGNPKGPPKHGESWASVLTWASNLTGEEAAKLVPPEMARFFRPLKGLELKRAIVLRVFAALLFEPSPSLFNAVMERIEGKVTQNIEINWRDEAKEQGYDPDKLVDEFARAMVASHMAGGASEGGSGDDATLATDGAA